MVSSLSENLLRTAESLPDKALYIDPTGSVTFRECVGAALSVAAALEKRGQSEFVALMLPTSKAHALMYFGVMFSGRVPVPLNFFLTGQELSSIIRDCGAKTIFTVRPFEKLARETGAEVVLVEDWLGEATSNPPAAPKDANPVATLLYTSGTTGRPKGVVLSQKNILANVQGCIAHYRFSSSHRILCLLPLFHSFALTTTLVLPAVVGATAVFMPRFSPKQVLKAIERHSITAMMAVPSMYRALFRSACEAGCDLSGLELPISGGEALDHECFSAWQEKLGVRIMEGYGLTETSPVISGNAPHAFKAGTVGKPLANLEVRIADENGQAVPAGVDGEIWVRGPSVMEGYHNLSDETGCVITGDSFLRTGDVGRFDEEGFLSITGRIKEMIISAGENIFPGEIEHVLLMHPAVAEAAVIGIAHRLRGEAPKAFVVLAEAASADEDELKDLCRNHVARYKVPVEIEFCDEFPHGPTGKILKKKLARDNAGGGGGGGES